MEWTRKKPTEAGYYWFRADDDKGVSAIVRVRFDDGNGTFYYTGNEIDFKMADPGDSNGEWAGPLQPH